MIDHVQQALEIYRTLSTGACIDKNLQQLFAWHFKTQHAQALREMAKFHSLFLHARKSEYLFQVWYFDNSAVRWIVHVEDHAQIAQLLLSKLCIGHEQLCRQAQLPAPPKTFLNE